MCADYKYSNASNKTLLRVNILVYRGELVFFFVSAVTSVVTRFWEPRTNE